MIENYLSSAWRAAALGLGNHLWQSTLVAAAAALLTLALRQHHARARYWIWLAASVKFLVPFSLLVAVGSHLAWQRHPAETASPALYYAIEEISQPFTQPAARVPSVSAASLISASLMHVLPWIAAVWLAGFLVVLLLWSVRWRRIAAAMKAASPSSQGRELAALRRLERIGGIRKPIALLLSPVSLEPGIFGIARPVLIWPEGISQYLEDPHLDAILAHEVWHVRRRDNLFAALHMLVEAVFWFYPLVWWLGARMLEERERACDEEVVELGSDRQVYAESILKVCEFCLGSPLPCVSGVTGADLKKRMVHIMTARILHKLDFTRKLLLSTVALLAITIPIAFGVLNATPGQAQSNDVTMTQPSRTFESVSIKPSNQTADGPTRLMFSLNDGSFVARGVSLRTLIKLAYNHLQDSQLLGGPDWLNTEKYDIDAKMSAADAAELHNLSWEQRGDQGMLKALLRDHFKLALHPEVRNLPVYDLVVDTNGPKFQESTGQQHMMRLGKGELVSQGNPLTLLTEQLSVRLGRTVVDKTGLKGDYAFSLHWMPDANEEARMKADGISDASLPASPETSESIFTALQEQLGLKLEPQNAAVPVMVVDHAEAPSEN